jgi:hypothetical protein
MPTIHAVGTGPQNRLSSDSPRFNTVGRRVQDAWAFGGDLLNICRNRSFGAPDGGEQRREQAMASTHIRSGGGTVGGGGRSDRRQGDCTQDRHQRTQHEAPPHAR